MENWVYIYRDLKGKVRYVGFGRNAERATSHQKGSHNGKLGEFLATNAFTLEIAGPYESAQEGRAVESALISALSPEFNVNLGETRWRFRPLGVPAAYAGRLVETPLMRSDLCDNGEGGSQTVLLVKISGEDFGDGRQGYNAAQPPKDREVLERICKWWQLKRYLTTWSENPDQSPALLIGIHGKPGSQIIIGSVFINQAQWGKAECDGSFVIVPTHGPRNLDALQLRGRRIDENARIRFNSLHSQIFRVLEPDGS